MYVILYVITDIYFFIAVFSFEDEHDEKLAPSSTISYSTHGDMDDPRKTKNRLGKQIYFKITLPCCYDTESSIDQYARIETFVEIIKISTSFKNVYCQQLLKINCQLSEIDNYKYNIMLCP